jgi:hypothetical protein
MRTPPWELRAIPRQREYTGIPAPDWPWVGIPGETGRNKQIELLRHGELGELVPARAYRTMKS